MANIVINLLLMGLLLLSFVMTVIILMQRPSANAGMGAALGGGAAESVFGGETANVLLKNTIWVAVGFFSLSFVLFLWIVSRVDHSPKLGIHLPPSAALSTAPATANGTAASGNSTATPTALDRLVEPTNPVPVVPPAAPKP